MKLLVSVIVCSLFSTFTNASVSRSHLVLRQTGDCESVGYVTCGDGCIPVGYTCCDGGSGGCEPGTYCTSNLGCCPIGETCTGAGGVSVGTIDITNTITYTYTSYSSVTYTSVAVTTSAVQTTPYVPTTGATTTTASPVASYTPGTPNSAPGQYTPALLVGCSAAIAILTLMASFLM